MSPAPTKDSVLLGVERTYYTDRMCRVQTEYYEMKNKMVVEDVTLECPREIVAGITSPTRSKR